MRVLITGAGGFVGKKAIDFFNKKGYEVYAHRRSNYNLPSKVKIFQGKTLSSSFTSPESLIGFDYVIHLAGRTYCKNRNKTPLYSEYFKDNVEET